MNLEKNGKKLCIKYFDESSQKYILIFSNEFHRAVKLKITQESIYFLVAIISDQEYFIYRGYDKNTFFACKSNLYDGRIFLHLPKSKHPYTKKTNYNGMFYIYSDTPVLAKFNESALDIISLKKI